MALPTVDDLKAHLNITRDDNDDELADILDAAVDVVSNIAGPIAEPAEVVETHYGVSSDVLVLRQMPVATLTAVSARAGAASTALLVADYDLDTSTGLLRSAAGDRFVGTFTVTYTAGRDDVPAAVRLATLEIAGHLWETQRGTSPSALALQQQDVDPTFAPGRGYAIPNRAQELLAPYIRPSIA